MTRRLWLILWVSLGLVLACAACGDSDPDSAETSPTPPHTASPTVVLAAPTQTPSGPTLTPSPTLPPTVTPLATLPAPPATDTPLPTETPGPYEHVIQAGDTCISIAYEHGHMDLDVLREIEAINSVRCSSLPGPGNSILVPRPTATPTVVGADLTQTAVATSAPPMVTLGAQQNYAVNVYVVQADDTLSSVAIINDTSLRMICELNQVPDKNPNGIDCRGCTWESVNCCCPNPPVLSVGQELFVPAPTPTPSPTATLTGSETPTSTPTHRAPLSVYPSEGAAQSGPVRLSWLSVGVLAEGETYLVTVRDETTGSAFSQETRQLSLDIPPEYLPADGQVHTLVWQVSVVRMGEDGLLYPVGPVAAEQRFTWQG